MSRRIALLGWYDRQGRDLPWRRTRDPYAIWVSEVMLQQTRVETALPYYRKFLARFPDVSSLAAAPLDEVLSHWSGLGYYRRARQLHNAAAEIDRAGAFPRTAEELRKLPGIGAYTAAAVASIAFGEPVPVVDGNVERVISRQHALDGPLRSAEGRRRVESAARQWIDAQRPGDSNQALMELGATVCLPRNPRCPCCPVASTCAARAGDEIERYPERAKKKAAVRVPLVAVVAALDGRLLLFKRPEGSELMAGLWELPSVARGSDRRMREQLSRRYGGSWDLDKSYGSFRHRVTYRALEVEVRGGRVRENETVAEGLEAGWFGREEIEAVATSSLVRKALGVWEGGRSRNRPAGS